MDVYFRFFQQGIEMKVDRQRLQLKYPRKIWQKFSKEKDFFLDNAVYLNTVCMPLVSGARELDYNTAKPFFKRYFDYSILKDIPSAVEDHSENTFEVLDQFKKVVYRFQDNPAKKPVFHARLGERAIVPFSCGKDSLLTLAVCNEIGLDPVSVYVNDTVSPSENKLKISFLRKLSHEHKLEFSIVMNEFEKLNDFEFWNKNESEKGYSHLILSFCFILIPYLKYYKAKYLFLGNERDLNYTFENKDGVRCYPSYDQSFEGTKRLNRLIQNATIDKANVSSIISPLHDLAIMKILHNRYSSFGRYQSSCPSLDTSRERRWCNNCTDDIRFYLYMKAVIKDPKKIGIRYNMLDKRFLKYHTLFNSKAKERYEKAGGDEQIKFAYYLAYKNGAKGYVIDLFKRRYLSEVKAKEDSLYKKYFGIHNSSLIPNPIRKKAVSLYKEELT